MSKKQIAIAKNYLAKRSAPAYKSRVMDFVLPVLVCLHCTHKWVPRSNARPGQCPLCACKTWDVPRSEVRKPGRPRKIKTDSQCQPAVSESDSSTECVGA
jgi:hypothetical protein